MKQDKRCVGWSCGYVGMFQGRENKRRGPKARGFLVIFKETKAGTQKAWEKVIEAMVREGARQEHVEICKPK